MSSIRLTKKSKTAIYNQHAGTGTIVYKSSTNVITYIDFYVSRKDGRMLRATTGKPIERLDFIEED